MHACMNDVGWILPNDERARQYARLVLECRMVNRLVQPVDKSSAEVRESLMCLKRGGSHHQT